MFVPSETPEVDCEAFGQVLPRYLSGKLDAPRIAGIRSHLHGCEACRADYASAARTMASLGAEQRLERQQVQLETARLMRERAARASEERGRSVGLRRMLVWSAMAVTLMLVLINRDPAPKALYVAQHVSFVATLKQITDQHQNRIPWP